MKRSFIHNALAAGFLLAALSGCETSSRKSVHTYERNEGPTTTETQSERPVEADHKSDSQMQSPGQMVSPGEMVVEPR